MPHFCQRFKLSALLASLVLSCGLALSEDQSQNWSQFRGPGARGVASNSNLPEKWSATELSLIHI